MVPAPDLTFTPSEGVTVPVEVVVLEALEVDEDVEVLVVVLLVEELDDDVEVDPLTDRKSDLIYPLFPE